MNQLLQALLKLMRLPVKGVLLFWGITMAFSCQSPSSEEHDLRLHSEQEQGETVLKLVKAFYLKQGGVTLDQGLFWHRQYQKYIPMLSMPCLDFEHCDLFFAKLHFDLHTKLPGIKLLKKAQQEPLLDHLQSPMINHAYFSAITHPQQSAIDPMTQQEEPILILRLLPDPYLFVSLHVHPSLDQESLLLMNPDINLILNYPRDETLISSLNAMKREFFLQITSNPQAQYAQIQRALGLKQAYLGIYEEAQSQDPQRSDQIFTLLTQRRGILIQPSQDSSKERSTNQAQTKEIRLLSALKKIDGGVELNKALEALEGEILVNGHARIDFKPQSKEDLTKFLEFLDKMIQKKIKVIRASELAL
jgi:hypothetical protein